MYETTLRGLGPQLGRWWQIDDEVNEVITEGLYQSSDFPIVESKEWCATLLLRWVQKGAAAFAFDINDWYCIFKVMSNSPIMKYLSVIFAICLLGMQMASCQSSPTPKGLYSQAYEKAKIRSFREAIIDLNKAIALDSNYADAYLLRGKIKVSLGQNEDACKDAKKAADLGNKEAAAICEQYCQVLGDEQIKSRIQPEDSLAKLYPNRPEPLYNISNVYFDAKQYRKAIEYCDKAISVDSNYAAAYYNKGACLINLGEKVKGCLLINKAAAMGYDLAIKTKPNCDALLKGN